MLAKWYADYVALETSLTVPGRAADIEKRRQDIKILEAKICTLIAREGGRACDGGMHFKICAGSIDGVAFVYFRAWIERRASPEASGFSTAWGRRASDVLPFAAPQKPSLRRQRAG